VQNQLLKEIQQAFADASASLERFKASTRSVSALEEAFRYAEQKFNVGLLTSLDYNVAKNNLTKSRSELLQAKYNYIFNTRILDFYRGIPIDLK
jgi:outer membrane protein